MCALDSFGVEEVVKAADSIACKCGDACPRPSAEAVTRWQADPQPPAPTLPVTRHERGWYICGNWSFDIEEGLADEIAHAEHAILAYRSWLAYLRTRA
jgi:hypothetical protein